MKNKVNPRNPPGKFWKETSTKKSISVGLIHLSAACGSTGPHTSIQPTCWKQRTFRKRLEGVKQFWKRYQKVPIKIGMSIPVAMGFVFLILYILGGAAWEKQSWWQRQCSCQFWLVLFGTFLQNGLAPSSLTPSSLFRTLSSRGIIVALLHENIRSNSSADAWNSIWK